MSAVLRRAKIALVIAIACATPVDRSSARPFTPPSPGSSASSNDSSNPHDLAPPLPRPHEVVVALGGQFAGHTIGQAGAAGAG